LAKDVKIIKAGKTKITVKLKYINKYILPSWATT
jgi:hypothetical protein